MIIGEKVVLVPFEDWNAGEIRRWMSDPYYRFYFKNMPEMLNAAQLRDFPKIMGMNVLMIYDRGQWEASFTEQFTPTPIGLCSWDNVRFLAKSCELGIIIDKDASGKHYGREAIFLFLDYLFNRLGLHKVSAHTAAEANDTNTKAMEVVGFQFESIVRDNFYMDGKWHDEKRLSILDSEFKGIKKGE